MVSLQNRNGSWRVIFRYKGEWHAFAIGEVSAADAAVRKASAEELLRLLKRNLLDLPSGCTIEHSLFHRGEPPEHATVTSNAKKELTPVPHQPQQQPPHPRRRYRDQPRSPPETSGRSLRGLSRGSSC